MSVVFPESIWAEIPIFLIFDTSFCQKKETLLQMYTAMPIEQIDSGLAWSVFLSTIIIHYHNGQHLLQTHAAQPGE